MIPFLLVAVSGCRSGAWEALQADCPDDAPPSLDDWDAPLLPGAPTCFLSVAGQLGIPGALLTDEPIPGTVDDSSLHGIVSAGWLLSGADFGSIDELLSDDRIPRPLERRLRTFVGLRRDRPEMDAAPVVYDHIMDAIAATTLDEGWSTPRLTIADRTLHLPAVEVAHSPAFDVAILIHEAGHARGSVHVNCETGFYESGGNDQTWDASFGEAAFLLQVLSEHAESPTWVVQLEDMRDSMRRGLCPGVDDPL